MTYFLRDKYNNTIVDLEFLTKTNYEKNGDKHVYHELSSGINIKNYSKLLLETNPAVQSTIVDVFYELSEYRGWLWENFYMVKKNVGNEDDGNEIMELISKNLKRIAKTLGLYYVTD